MERSYMQQSNFEIYQKWVAKSFNDLESAKKLAKGENPILDTDIYHCQQSAEKAIKAFLVFNDINFPKTHDLSLLVEFCINIDKDFDFIYDEAEFLTPLSTEYRYPDDVLEPSLDEFKEALKCANKVYDFIKFKLQT
jgi:HEPN domain-containing protein